MNTVNKVKYVLSSDLLNASNAIPAIKKRAKLVHGLIHAYGLTGELSLVPSTPASESDIAAFHVSEYIQYLKSFNIDTEADHNEKDDYFGLGKGFDCPPLHDTWFVARNLAGASLCAADALMKGDANIVINWCGGWHHAQRDSASGFCYVNDIVLAIQHLRKKFNKILYIDLDVHHGDGVENAFMFSPNVMTFSVHLGEAGFFPGTGKVSDVGLGEGRFYSVNAPYKTAISDTQMKFLFCSVLRLVKDAFAFDAVVCQCGADALAGDPLGGANLSLKGYLQCVYVVLGLGKPTLLLGGGGYNVTNAARLWTSITFLALKHRSIPEEIPEHSFFPRYGPDFTLNVNATLRKSENSEEYLEEVVKTIKANLTKLSHLRETTTQQLTE